ncbi:MAG: NFACT RNA binding domain-containing protein [Candidatus Kapaibacterium sp.]
MVRNYYTLYHIAREFQTLAGMVADECFSQDKDSVILRLNDGLRENHIVFTADGKSDSIYLKHDYKRAAKNTVKLLEFLDGDVFQSASVLGRSRIIELKFLNSKVYSVLFGGKYSSLILTKSDDLIIDAFNYDSNNQNEKFVYKEESLTRFGSSDAGMSIKSALSNSDYLFGNVYAGEVITRLSHTDEYYANPDFANFNFSDLDDFRINQIIFESDKLRNELIESDKFFVLVNKSDRKLMSPVRLHGYEVLSEHSSPSDAVHRKLVASLVEVGFKSEYNRIKNHLSREERKLSKTIEIMKDFESVRQRESDYRLSGEILLSRSDAKQKHGDKIVCKDWEANEIVIKLDPKLNLIDNAKKYFDKAHSASEELKFRKIRLPDISKKLDSVRNKLIELDGIKNLKELSRFDSSIKNATGKRTNTKKMTMEDKFRKFDLGEGYILYAGKNAANNDELTMKFANPNDVWLHARGTSGSHTVIRQNKEEKPPKHILQKAAEITAYYSGAKNAKYVPVIWTYKKYVRKPKGANVGSVIVSKETVIMATPKLPEGNN